MWCDLDNIWQEVFSLAWKSFKRNTIPIGAVVVSGDGKIIARGRNMIYDNASNSPLAGTYMGHAEMAAMIELKGKERCDIKKYTLYTSMEPCPMCFGTMVMMGIRNLIFAARDGFAGATELNEKMEYIRSKKIQISMESNESEVFQICLQTTFECGREHLRLEEILDSWRGYCSDGVLLGKKLFEEGFFKKAIDSEESIAFVYNHVIARYHLLYSSKAL